MTTKGQRDWIAVASVVIAALGLIFGPGILRGNGGDVVETPAPEAEATDPSTDISPMTTDPGSDQSEDVPGCDRIVVTSNEVVEGDLTESDCISEVSGVGYYSDHYVFEADAGGRISIGLSSLDFDAYLFLMTESGRVLFDDAAGGGDVGISDSRIPSDSGFVEIPAAGTYVVEVSSYYQDETGAYRLTLASPENCDPVTVSLNEVVEGELSASDCTSAGSGEGYYSDQYRFEAQEGDEVSIGLSSLDFDAYLYLLTEDRKVLFDDAAGGGDVGISDSRIPADSGFVELPSSGTYIIDVTSYYLGETGAYRLDIVGR
ncbi:MAG: PPC domain-containing protein [Actinomycetota bacterium]|nr:PPC domain-containing protein [Actinomycetota bacterium]